MSIKEFFRLLLRHWVLLVVIPIVTSISIYFFGRNQDKKYVSDTVIYTGIASGYKIEGDNNNAGGNWDATATAFDNLLELISSRDTKKEVGLRLIAKYIFDKNQSQTSPSTSPDIVIPPGEGEKFAEPAKADLLASLKSIIFGPAAPVQKELIPLKIQAVLLGETLEETSQKVISYYKKNNSNILYRIINSNHPVYSEKALNKISASRIKGSDLVKVEYESNNPEMCYQTLQVLTQVFIRKHKELFAGQNESVIGYFDEATQKAYERLQAAEKRMLAFHKAHNLVDYDKEIAATTGEKQLALDKYNTLQNQYAGAVSAAKSLEIKLKNSGAANLNSQEIMRLRNRLSDLNSQIMELEIMNNGQPNSDVTYRLNRLKQEAQTVSGKIDDNINKDYASRHSAKGVAVKDLLNDYVKNTLAVEELRGQISSMRQQKEGLANNYNKLVPLGAEIRKLRREVEFAEKEYLSQVEGLKQSRLSQQNNELASQLKVVDPPYLPESSGNLKFYLLIVGGFIGSFLFTGAGVVAADMLNTSLQKPSYATRITNMPVMGILPKTTGLKKGQLLEAKRAEDQLARQLLLKFQQKKDQNGPFVVGVLSSYSGEGKSKVCSSLANNLETMRIQTYSLFPNDHANHIAEDENISFYSPLQGIAQGITVADLAGTRVYKNPVVIVEFPALLEAAYPASLLQNLDLILVTVKANRSWHEADKTLFQNIREITDAPVELVLNGVLPEFVADFIGTRIVPTGRKATLPPHPEQALLNA